MASTSFSVKVVKLQITASNVRMNASNISEYSLQYFMFITNAKNEWHLMTVIRWMPNKYGIKEENLRYFSVEWNHQSNANEAESVNPKGFCWRMIGWMELWLLIVITFTCPHSHVAKNDIQHEQLDTTTNQLRMFCIVKNRKLNYLFPDIWPHNLSPPTIR